ncbi:MAG: 50S ribosomal protein L9, partial [Atribacterota bacterium]|nr:50S ribosomal protein L9 [Atribacterota bacterium]
VKDMRVILIQEVKNLGKEGDVVEVKEGYARNYLIPKKMAIEATPGNLSQIEKLRKKRAMREAKELEEAKALQGKIEGMILTFSKKAGETGKLYGSVTAREIAEAISALIGFEFDRKYLELPEPLKDLGKHNVRVNLGKGIAATITVNILPEETIEKQGVKES